MTSGMKTVLYPVKDLAAAKRIYSTLLGIKPDMDEAYYVGFTFNGCDIGLDPNGHAKGMTGPVGYWHVDDIKESLRALTDAGAAIRQEITDVGEGTLIATVEDADGNTIGLRQTP
jgi:predicted enzyme related to lactoylglutathione lyase